MIHHGDFVIHAFKLLPYDNHKIAVNLECKWGTLECHRYFKELLTNHNRESRQGFFHETYSMLILLYCVHMEAYGDFGEPLVLSSANLDTSSLTSITEPKRVYRS